VLLKRRQLFGTCRNAGRPGDRDETAARRFFSLLERGEKRVTRHAPHDRIRHEAQRGRYFTALRHGFELNVHTSVALFEAGDATYTWPGLGSAILLCFRSAPRFGKHHSRISHIFRNIDKLAAYVPYNDIFLYHARGERAISRLPRQMAFVLKSSAKRLDYPDVPLAQCFTDACQERHGAR